MNPGHGVERLGKKYNREYEKGRNRGSPEKICSSSATRWRRLQLEIEREREQWLNLQDQLESVTVTESSSFARPSHSHANRSCLWRYPRWILVDVAKIADVVLKCQLIRCRLSFYKL